ncbi:hypothetical protein LDENG_00272240 [Lucifuga dentata]|nr:hypothetical protein LDENG_00272240 [Lucifuga dentata]
MSGLVNILSFLVPSHPILRRTRPLSSASVCSVTVHDRLSELVKMFKERTDCRKDRLVDPDESQDESPTACMSTQSPNNLLVQLISSRGFKSEFSSVSL